jgi:hydrogenase maturation protease
VDVEPSPIGDLVEREVARLFRFGELEGEVAVGAAPVSTGVLRLRVVARNMTATAASDRARATGASLASAHVLLGVTGGEIVSSTDPPPHLRDAADASANEGVWPVLVGPRGRRDVALASPIILEDHAQIAPESPGDLCDATEIDEILTLRILTLTDAEKAEARATDPRARAILDRAEALGPDALLSLHGALRAKGAYRPGARVRLRPRHRADVMDLALAGRVATITSVERDYEGTTFVAVTVDDDPGKDLGAAGFPGHRFFFRTDEVEVLP